MTNKVLVVGSGGREHALAYSFAQDCNVDEVLIAKGNSGTARDEKCRNINIDGASKKNFRKLIDLVEEEDVKMVVVGPELHLVNGIVDFFQEKGYNNIFGPTSAAFQIEADKFYSYMIMKEIGIPQAESIFCNTIKLAKDAIKKIATDKGVVIKARGLTAGKGVYVCDSKDEALSKIEKHAEKYGLEVLITERLFGQEFSVFGISDGEKVVPLEISVQDHKPLLDGDKGSNTGGMGAYCPAPIADAEKVRYIAKNMMTPVVQLMKKQGKIYKGFLYAAVIMTEDGPKILEYNCRFGDPEAQPSVMMLKDSLYKPISAALNSKLNEINIEFKPGAACCVVMASNGYPAAYEKGFLIGGLEKVADEFSNVKVFHAGTGIKDGKIVTNGGRVLGVTAYSEEGISKAQYDAYSAVSLINKATTELNEKIIFIYRGDIANKAI